MDTHIQTHTNTTTGATLEVATLTFEGKAFTAQGSCIDEEHGLIRAYVSGIPGAYSLHTFAGLTLAPLTLVSTYRVRTCFGVGRFAGGVKMYAWRCMFNGRKYHGRNGGPMMVVHMRCTTRVKHTQMG